MDTSSILVSALESLSPKQRTDLGRGNIKTVAEMMFLPRFELAKKCRITHTDAQNMVDRVCQELYRSPLLLDDPSLRRDEVFSTGDDMLDRALGGGLRTGMIWEIVGESAAGKSQLAFQLSLFVQLAPSHGGISGSACYLSTSWTLPTQRLLEIIDENPLLSPDMCGLSDVFTLKAPTQSILVHILTSVLPNLIKKRRASPGTKPVKLLVIDALTELFHNHDKHSRQTLYQRSRDLSEISLPLHTLASTYNIAIVVLNEVTDTFHHFSEPGEMGGLAYSDQVKFFGRADSVPGEDKKEAALGLVWANLVNARIMLSRTERMRDLSDHDIRPSKRRRVEEQGSTPHPSGYTYHTSIRIRRLTVVFNQHAPPASLDYVVTGQGISIVSEDSGLPPSQPRPDSPPSNAPRNVTPLVIPGGEADSDLVGLQPSDEAPAEDGAEEGPHSAGTDEWEEYWRHDASFYEHLDINALSSSNSG